MDFTDILKTLDAEIEADLVAVERKIAGRDALRDLAVERAQPPLFADVPAAAPPPRQALPPVRGKYAPVLLRAIRDFGRPVSAAELRLHGVDGLSTSQVMTAVDTLCRHGSLARVGFGLYALTEGA